MGTFDIHVIGKGHVSELVGHMGIGNGKEFSAILVLDSPDHAKKILQTLSNLTDFNGSVVIASGVAHEKLLEHLEKNKVYISGVGTASHRDTLDDMVRNLIISSPFNLDCSVKLVKNVRDSLHAQVSPYGPQRRKAFSSKCK